MILTGNEILKEVEKNRICISPFDKNNIEPNSYGFRLSDELIEYEEGEILDIRVPPKVKCSKIPQAGYVFQPGRFYLVRTLETMGSNYYAKTLHARFSVSSMGMWIQFSAPLGHTGAIIPWTLEITVAHPIKVYPGMKVGKIAFWKNEGELFIYNGKYKNSDTVVASRCYQDFDPTQEQHT